ncbi:MAG: radical SAM protein [Oscillospiraceae bacterium]|jgi:uncharacterized radical SAM superfamily Fe-S cluster-containing enzyme|nr:radical SAM protein [Oscillospiraceae bacterium]
MTELAVVVERTKSVCPVCLRSVDARIVRVGGEYFMRKQCAEHGKFSAVVWRTTTINSEQLTINNYVGSDDFTTDTIDNYMMAATCCALVEVTSRCNLCCPVCFAESGEIARAEPSVDELYGIFKRLCDDGNTFIQLSGGEPTVRDDLPEIIAAARRAGAETVQLNSNGLRLAREPDYAKTLHDAGLSFVFMQFDGTRGDIYERLRGRDLFADKLAAIGNCGAAKLGVTLVPTVVPDVNLDNVGEIVNFALSRSPDVRGVHFQPVSYFGRYPSPPRDRDRVTLPEILRAVELQTNGRVRITDFAPSSCDHPRCGFHGDFVVLPRGQLLKITPKYDPDACCAPDAHIKNRKFVSRRWTRGDEEKTADNADFSTLDNFAKRAASHGFTITAMAFQDAYTLDIARLRRCSLHVADASGRVKPFCAQYLTRV